MLNDVYLARWSDVGVMRIEANGKYLYPTEEQYKKLRLKYHKEVQVRRDCPHCHGGWNRTYDLVGKPARTICAFCRGKGNLPV